MFNLKKTLSVILLSLLCLSLFACTGDSGDGKVTETDKAPETNVQDTTNSSDTSEDTMKETDAKTEKATDAETEAPKPKDEAVKYNLTDVENKLKFHGRVTKLSTSFACDATGGGIEFRIKAKGKVVLTVLAQNQESYFTVYVDGERKNTRFKADPGSPDTLNIAYFGDEGEHTIRVAKQTEAQYSLCELLSIEFMGEFLDPPAYTDKYIEIIGDSITAGTGNLVRNTAAGQANNQDGTKAWPYLAAEALGVDASIVSCGGIGIGKGFRDEVETEFYPFTSYFRDKTTEYSFERKPNLVFVNLGTNDVSKDATENQVKTETKKLIEMIREKNGGVPIVFTRNLMNDAKAAEWMKAVITEMGGESAGLYQFTLNKDGEGGSGHPTKEGHAIAADMIVSFVNQKGFLK